MKNRYDMSCGPSPRVKGAIAAGLALTLAMGSCGVVEAKAATTSDVPEGVYLITSKLSDKALDIAGANTSNGGNIQTYDSNGTYAQYWRVTKVGEHYSIKNSLTGASLDVTSACTSNGTNVQMYQSNGSRAQLWDFVKNDDGSYAIVSALKDGLVLDVQWAGRENGTNVQVYAANGSAAQSWNLIKTEQVLSDGTYSITSSLDGKKSLDVNGASRSNGAAIQLYGSNGTLAQKWGLTYNSQTGFYTISAANSGKSLDIPGADTSSGVRIQQYSSNGTAAQAWRIIGNEDGSYTLVSALSGLALDVPAGNAQNGSRIQAYTSNGTRAQKWNISETNLGGIYQLASAIDEGAVVDVSSASTAQDARIQVWSGNGTLAQKWKLIETDGGSYLIKNANSGRYLRDSGSSLASSESVDSSSADAACQWIARVGNGGITFLNAQTGKALDLSSANTVAGTRVGTYAANGTSAQAWVLKSTGLISDGCYTISNRAGRKQVIDVPSGSLSDRVSLQTYESNDTGAQKWNVKTEDNGWYSIANAKSGKVLDVRNGTASSGAIVQQYTSNGTDAQRWRFDVAPSGGVMVLSKLGSNLALSTNKSEVTNGTGLDIETYSSASNSTFSWSFAATTYNAASNQQNNVSYVEVQKIPSDYSTVYIHMKDGSTKSYTVWCGANTFTGTFSVKHTAYALDKNPTFIGGNSYDSRDINGWWVCYVEDWKSTPDDPDRSRKGCDQGTHANEYDEGQGFHYGLPGGSKGCILFPAKGDAAEFYELMKQNIGATIRIY